MTQRTETAAQKARMRGRGEVYLGTYGELLQRVESRMQSIFFRGERQSYETQSVEFPRDPVGGGELA